MKEPKELESYLEEVRKVIQEIEDITNRADSRRSLMKYLFQIHKNFEKIYMDIDLHFFFFLNINP